MNLIPMPKKIKESNSIFKIKRGLEIVLEYTCDFNDLESAIILQDAIQDVLGFKANITKSFTEDMYARYIRFKKKQSMTEEEYNLIIENEYIEIIAGTSSGIFYGVQTLIQIIQQYGAILPGVIIEDKPYFKNRGFYHDVTRGKVPKLETLKELVDKAAFYKINQIQLYIEHTFAFKGMSEVWIDKDPLTAEEIILLDKYCRSKYIELIPSIATFGHLYEVLRTKTFKKLCELNEDKNSEYSFVDRMAHHTLNVSDEGSIKLVSNMLNQFIPLFSSNKFNICCDETFDLGKEKSLERANEVGVGRLYIDFLNKVISIVKKYNKEIMFWGDVILNHPDLISEIDRDIICLNWNYWCGVTEKDTKIISDSDRKQYVCPGVGGWSHLMNLMDNAFENITRMVSYGVKYNAIGVLNTNWGDYGHINLWPSSIPGMVYGASLSWNPIIPKDFEEFYKNISILEFKDNSGTIVSLLSDLSKLQQFGWSELVIWKEKFHTNEVIKSELVEKMKNIQVSNLINNYEKALEIEEKLQEISSEVREKDAIQEFIVASRGIGLINLIFEKIISNEIYKDQNSNCEANNLAEQFEEWFYDYSFIWRMTNKESELYRIKEVIKYTCDYLREL